MDAITLQTFFMGLMIASTLTGLVTEAVKKILTECKKTYKANTLTGIIATVLSAAISVGYILVTGIGFTTQTILYAVALVFLSWLCAMVGYDKVVQTFAQFKTKKEE